MAGNWPSHLAVRCLQLKGRLPTALDLGRKVLAVKVAIQNPNATDAMQAITELGHDQRYYIMLRGWLLMQLQADQSIVEANKQDVSESILERIDFIKSAIRRIDLE